MATLSFLPRLSGPSRSPVTEVFIQELEDLQQLLKINLQEAIKDYKTQANHHRRPHPKYQPGDLVYLNTKSLPIKWPSRKLGPRYIGPFTILEQVGEVAYCIELPQGYHVHNLFHASLLLRQDKRPHSHQEPFHPSPELVEGHPEFEVEDIISHRHSRGVL